jgi:hypothetical protein
MIGSVRRGITLKAAVTTGTATVKRRVACINIATDQDSAKYKTALRSIPLGKITVCRHRSQCASSRIVRRKYCSC